MKTLKLQTKDLQNINGGTKQDYNAGRELGSKIINTVKSIAYNHFGHCFLYELLN
jgi:hypothetical protein